MRCRASLLSGIFRKCVAAGVSCAIGGNGGYGTKARLTLARGVRASASEGALQRAKRFAPLVVMVRTLFALPPPLILALFDDKDAGCRPYRANYPLSPARLRNAKFVTRHFCSKQLRVLIVRASLSSKMTAKRRFLRAHCCASWFTRSSCVPSAKFRTVASPPHCPTRPSSGFSPPFQRIQRGCPSRFLRLIPKTQRGRPSSLQGRNGRPRHIPCASLPSCAICLAGAYGMRANPYFAFTFAMPSSTAWCSSLRLSSSSVH